MTVLLGAMLAAGLLLAAAPWLWPRATPTPRGTGPGALARRAAVLLESAGYATLATRVLAVAIAACALVASAVVWLVTATVALTVLAAVAAACAPVVWLRARASKLVRERRAMWPDVCDLLVGSVRAGLSLPDAVSALAGSAPPAVRGGFARFERDMRQSGHFPSSLDRLKQALADPMADRIIETLRMAREVGGTELVPVLRALSASIRSDAALRGEVESKQSWTKGAAILGVVAPWAVLVLLSLRPAAASAYGSPGGIALILVGAAVSVVAYRVMLRVGRLPEPRRWFA